MPNEPIDLPDDIPGEARLFPMPDLVFFPHNIQPLHIFESRYREMMEDALAGDGLIALATLEPGYEIDYYSRPPVAPVACVGRIAHYEQHENGTFDLLLMGLCRVRLGQEVTPVRSFRRASVTVLEDGATFLSDPEAQQVSRQLVDRLVGAVPALSTLASEFHKEKIPLGVLTDVVAFHLPLSVPVKLDLLAETDAVRRATILLSCSLDGTKPADRPVFPPRFGQN